MTRKTCPGARGSAAVNMPSGPPPVLLLVLASLAQVLAAGSAVALARRSPGHRPVSWFLAVVTLANLALLAFILGGAPVSLPGVPYAGLARVIHHVREALYLTWSFGFAWMAVAVFTGKRLDKVFFGAYLLTVLVFILGYPVPIGGESLQRSYLVVELSGLLIGFGMLVQFTWRRESVSVSHLVAILLLFGEVAVLIGAWRKDVFSGWDVARLMYLVTYVVISLVQGGKLWKRSR